MSNRFDGRTVVITGVASGIGYEMARQFRDEGAVVFAADLNPDAVPDGTTPVHVDVTDPDSVQALIKQAADGTGRLDVLCNDAAFVTGSELVIDGGLLAG